MTTEHQIHASILKYLRAVLPHGWLVMHVPNGGSRNPIEGARMKALGVVAGWPDISIYGGGHNSGGQAFFMEVKSAKGRLSNCQHQIIDRLKDMGFPVAVVRSIDDAQRLVAEWGLPSRQVRS
jgi:hypothetical protein